MCKEIEERRRGLIPMESDCMGKGFKETLERLHDTFAGQIPFAEAKNATALAVACGAAGWQFTRLSPFFFPCQPQLLAVKLIDLAALGLMVLAVFFILVKSEKLPH